jgi:hypothetical protein
VPDWGYDRLIAYNKKADAVVTASKLNQPKNDAILHFSLNYADNFYTMISNLAKRILDSRNEAGQDIPASHTLVSIDIDGINKDIEKILIMGTRGSTDINDRQL